MYIHLIKKKRRKCVVAAIVLLPLVLVCSISKAQAPPKPVRDTTDLIDVLRKVFKKKDSTVRPPKVSSVALLPTLSYNPSFGFIFGAKATVGRQLGNPENTNYSILGLEAFITTKGILTAQVRHNVFTPGNTWNWQGHWQISRMGMIDYGLGTGDNGYNKSGFAVNEYPTTSADSSFPIAYNYLRLFEKVYRKIGNQLYAGVGLAIDRHSKIDDEKNINGYKTPHQLYSERNDIDPEKYWANGIIVALQFNNREHPIRSYGGIYADLSFRINQTWLGSTKNASQVLIDFRKYWSLSKSRREHVIAFWSWGAYRLSGVLPYLDLPTTASDTYARSGRGYTFGRFKGPSYSYFETEYRFPITANMLLSGVCFINMQSASDDLGNKLFSSWEPGGGAGLRILFQKASRVTMCIDFAKGRYGSSGIFFGLNEVF